MWVQVENGATIGKIGSEEGIIILDEEYTNGARITLEKAGVTAPWSITCGGYGLFMHTSFQSTESDSRKTYKKMKKELESIMNESDSETAYKMIKDFCDRY
ncbi:hypothetical protein AB3N59_10620 [Leptospira sp. WS92.C1]